MWEDGAEDGDHRTEENEPAISFTKCQVNSEWIVSEYLIDDGYNDEATAKGNGCRSKRKGVIVNGTVCDRSKTLAEPMRAGGNPVRDRGKRRASKHGPRPLAGMSAAGRRKDPAGRMQN